MKVFTINQSIIRNLNRMDAEFVKDANSATHTERIPLKELCEFIRTGPSGSTIPASAYMPKGIPLIRPSNLDLLTCDNSDIVYISKDFLNKKKLHEYTFDDILLSRVGDIKFGIVYGFDQTITISPNIVAIRVNPKILNPYYLLAFLQTKPARQQLYQGIKRVSISSLSISNIGSLRVPKIPINQQNEIGLLIQNALGTRLQAKKLFRKAETVVMNTIQTDLKPVAIQASQSQISLLKIKKARRMDAEYLLTSNSSQSIMSLRLHEIAEITRGIEVGTKAYQETGKLFLRVGNISKYGLLPKSQKYITGELYKKLKQKYQPKPGDILLVKDGKPGTCCLINENLEGIISEGIVRIRTKKLDSFYIVACINSLFCQQQIRQNIDGSLVPHIKMEQLKNLSLPMLPDRTRSTLTKIYSSAYSLLTQSKKNISLAITKTNQQANKIQQTKKI